tara:strand:- start:335 stop:571 length:237 start_codon:yes stop_codon:yes gene_type:complete
MYMYSMLFFGKECDPVSLLETGAGKGIGQLIDPLAGLAIRDRSVSHNGKTRVRTLPSVKIKKIVKTHRPSSQLLLTIR